MNYSFHPEARLEFLEAIAYYEDCSDGLGMEFLREVFASIRRIVEFPLAWSALSENSRRCLTKRFPFGIIYQILDDEILIVAVTHLNREPRYWERRLK
jgi:plasmid stabilization system protein ParE